MYFVFAKKCHSIVHEQIFAVTGVTSDVVKVKGEDPATPGPLP